MLLVACVFVVVLFAFLVVFVVVFSTEFVIVLVLFELAVVFWFSLTSVWVGISCFSCNLFFNIHPVFVPSVTWTQLFNSFIFSTYNYIINNKDSDIFITYTYSEEDPIKVFSKKFWKWFDCVHSCSPSNL